MAEVKTIKPNESIADEWLEEDGLLLLEAWARDGYTFEDISNRIGITERTLRKWREIYPEIRDALKKGREIIDYKVENALLKSALGFRTKEVKVTTLMRYGKVVETTTENLEKEIAPNVTACQVWLYNRCQEKWKKSRDNVVEINDEDSSIQITVTRADTKNGNEKQQPDKETNSSGYSADDHDEEDWADVVNTNITLTKKKPDEYNNKPIVKEKEDSRQLIKKPSKTVIDLDYWPEDYEDA